MMTTILLILVIAMMTLPNSAYILIFLKSIASVKKRQLVKSQYIIKKFTWKGNLIKMSSSYKKKSNREKPYDNKTYSEEFNKIFSERLDEALAFYKTNQVKELKDEVKSLYEKNFFNELNHEILLDAIEAIEQKRFKTNKDICAAIGEPENKMSKWTNRYDTCPTIEELVKLADLLNVSTDYLLCRIDSPQSSYQESIFFNLSSDATKVLAEELRQDTFYSQFINDLTLKDILDNFVVGYLQDIQNVRRSFCNTVNEKQSVDSAVILSLHNEIQSEFNSALRSPNYDHNMLSHLAEASMINEKLYMEFLTHKTRLHMIIDAYFDDILLFEKNTEKLNENIEITENIKKSINLFSKIRGAKREKR